ncbi:MAG: hypothetical protein JWR67_788 [Mucilaginibacter sp.]|nr:hypothetical protein [Mucilaginibacter sp.]
MFVNRRDIDKIKSFLTLAAWKLLTDLIYYYNWLVAHKISIIIYYLYTVKFGLSPMCSSMYKKHALRGDCFKIFYFFIIPYKGNVNQNVQPLPNSLSTPISPPWRLMISEEIYNPKPNPEF